MLEEPTVYTANQLQELIKDWPQTQTRRTVETNGKTLVYEGWVPARGLTMKRLMFFKRLKLAWLVFTGQADVLRWDKAFPWDKNKLS